MAVKKNPYPEKCDIVQDKKGTYVITDVSEDGYVTMKTTARFKNVVKRMLIVSYMSGKAGVRFLSRTPTKVYYVPVQPRAPKKTYRDHIRRY